jgi:hypothetical protein
MRNPEQDKERIKHILEAIENILNFTEGIFLFMAIIPCKIILYGKQSRKI